MSVARRDGLKDFIWAAGLIWAGVGVLNALRSLQSSQHAPRLQAERIQREREMLATLKRIERRLGNG